MQYWVTPLLWASKGKVFLVGACDTVNHQLYKPRNKRKRDRVQWVPESPLKYFIITNKYHLKFVGDHLLSCLVKELCLLEDKGKALEWIDYRMDPQKITQIYSPLR